jgi:hypothetical protein
MTKPTHGLGLSVLLAAIVATLANFSTIGQGYAPDTRVFGGINVGEPLALKECKKGFFGGGTVPEMCWRYPPIKSPGGEDMRMLVFPKDSVPPILQSDFALFVVTIQTKGVQNESELLSQLLTKYGAPSIRVTRGVQNLAGAKFDSVHAEWRFPSLVVLFEGTSGTLTSGSLTIATPDAAPVSAAPSAPSL